MKIAKIFVGDPHNQKGAFNNVIERCKRLVSTGANVDCYMIRYYHSPFLRLLKKRLRGPYLEKETIVQGLNFQNIWIEMRLWDYLLAVKLRRRLPMGISQLNNFIDQFSNYDLLSVHGYESVYIANECKKKYGVPFVSTWHGSDINYTPFFNKFTYERVKYFLQRSDHNFFVSEHLMKRARTVSSKMIGTVLYTGPSDFFLKSNHEVFASKIRDSISESKKIVAFIGNLVSVKNVLVLPEIFYQVRMKSYNTEFLVVGDGYLRSKLNAKFKTMGLEDVVFLGKLEPEAIPEVMKSIDVLVLPSFNEGLPRVTLEAQTLGVAVVGSDRGGIPEAIGGENSFALDDDFISKISDRIVSILESGERPAGLPEKFSWDYALKHEKEVHQLLCGR